MQYEASAEYPFGRVNPDAPAALADYEPMIGICDCQSFVAKPDGTWNVPEKMTWMFKYIMNGTAVQDQTLKEGGGHSGSIRQYSSDSAKWYVHYYAVGKITSVSGYHGSAKEDDIVLYKRVSDISHEGKDLYYRLTFSSVTKNGFNWIGEWVDPSATPDTAFGATWKIECIKRED
ncbi:MAG: hypothetical protein ABJP45_10060 [Cyclobacteriaceae bacterium]